jgi:DNA helicase II / ATP-dependent DNA helicase PcrA
MDERKIFKGLNDEQTRAAKAVTGPVCILAGAGSGKTTTITRRIANQVASGTFAAGSILAVTFTDKAAGEMRTRLVKLGVQGVRARTFHAAALAQLRHLSSEPPGQILPSKGVALRQIARSLPRPYRFRPVADLATEIEWAKNRRVTPDTYEASLDGHQPPVPADQMQRIYRQYERSKNDRGMMDFEDLLERAIQMFQNEEWAREQFHGRYAAFTVDEYQDVNLLQETLLREWLGDGDNICVVGDDYQSIYGFTGATPQYLLEMPKRFARTQVIRLEDNYRSTPQILEVANRLVPKLGGAEKVLRAVNEDGDEPMIRLCSRQEAESRVIVDRIRGLHDSGVPFEEMALLYRVNFRSEDHEEVLAGAGIPYQVKDGAFLTRPTARQMLSTLRRSSAQSVAAEVRRLADRAGYVEDIPDGAGEQEITRQNDLARFVRLAEEFDDGARSCSDFVQDIEARFGTEGDGRGVQLMTLHRAKGLEFDAVFLPRVEEGELPFKRSKSDEAIAEERRLFYVGITRARKHLTITWVNDGKRKGSRFIGEVRSDGTGGPVAFRREPDPTHAAVVGLQVTVSGGFAGTIVDITPAGALLELEGGGELLVPFGENVTAAGETMPLGPPEDEDKGLIAALKGWRLERAKTEEVPAYVVFHDSTLEEIARRKPRSLEELSEVAGIGPAKLERYGNDILQALK